MRKIYTLLMFLLFVVNCWSQSQKDNYTFTLNGHSVVAESDFETILRNASMDADASKPQYVILQFNKLPGIAQQKQLRSNGIVLQNYVLGNAYYAHLLKGVNGIKTRDAKLIRSLYTIKPSYKIDKKLSLSTIPAYAKSVSGLIKVEVTCFYLPADSELQNDIMLIGAFNSKVVRFFKSISLEISQDSISRLAELPWVKNVQMVSPPMEINNSNGSSLHRADVLRSTQRGLGYGLTGKGVRIGVWDGDVENHRDFGDRVIQREYDYHVSPHGTHVTGSITGAGILDPHAAGAAPEATIVSWNFNVGTNGLFVPEERLFSLMNDGIEITSNSYGYLVKECPSPFNYNTKDMYEDIIASHFPYFLYVFSAGNSQSYCSDGYYTTDKNLKNSLIVAAADKQSLMSGFSSFGPSHNGRLVPNITGDGVGVYSTIFDQGYDTYNGTSMSTPGVAGTMALLYQYYKEMHGGQRPLSSLMRALACNTASDFGHPGPDYKYGYGVINGRRAAEVLSRNSYFSDIVEQGDVITKKITVPQGAIALRVMLAWTDSAATPGVDYDLVNDLDLSVIHNNVEVLPWVLDPANPNKNAVRGVDNLNVFEQVTIDNPTKGTYSLAINGDGVATGSQQFSVVYDVVMPSLQVVSPAVNSSIEPNSDMLIQWDCEGYSAPITIEYSNDNGVHYSVLASNIPVTNRAYLWTTPSEVVRNARIRISSGRFFSETKGSFSLMTVPTTIEVELPKCDGVGPFFMSWDSIANARYEVLKLDGATYEHLAYVTDSSYNISNLDHGDDNYFCVKAIDITTGAVSERSVAVKANPVVPVSEFPFSENFESQKAANFFFNKTSGYGSGSLRYLSITDHYGLLLEGASSSDDWVDASGEECFVTNPNYIVSAQICNIDLSRLEISALSMEFDYRQNFSTSVGTSFFRVKVNGNTLSELMSGNATFSDKTAQSYSTLYYDLSPYLGESSVSIEFEAVCKSAYTSIDSEDNGDFVAIDNIEIRQVREDLSLESVDIRSGVNGVDTVLIQVKNVSNFSVANIPVALRIKDEIAIFDTIFDDLLPFSDTIFVLNQLVDLSNEGIYSLHVSVNYPTDIIPNNNVLIKEFIRDYSIKMGVDSGIVKTDSARFTDSGGRFKHYSKNEDYTITFAPLEPNSVISVTFNTFDTEEDFDYLYVYNGASVNASLLDYFSGTIAPTTYTSTAPNGELTFSFLSDDGTESIGWDADIVTITKPAYSIALSNFVVTNGELSFTVENLGGEPLESYKLYYQINNSPAIFEQITTTLAAGRAEVKTLTNLLAPSGNASDSITVWVEMENDANLDDNQMVDIISTNSSILRMVDAEKVIHTSGTMFTDDGGAFSNYSSDKTTVYTFIPNQSSEVCRLTFESFDLEEDFDYLYVYNGTSVSAPLLGVFTGSTLPVSVTSTAKSGALTVKFIADPAVTGAGWIAAIDMVTASSESSVDVGVSEIVSVVPRRVHGSTVVAKVTNYGPDSISDFEVAYRINNSSEATMLITDTLGFGDEAQVIFSALADISAIDSTFLISVYTKAVDDIDISNDTISLIYKHNSPAEKNVVSHFTSSKNCVVTDTTMAIEMQNNYTFEAWVNLSEPASFGYIFSKVNVNLFYSTHYGSGNYGFNSYILYVTTNSEDYVVYVPEAVVFGVWQHLALTVSDNNVYTLYINGIPQTWSVKSGVATAAKSNGMYPLVIGNRLPDLARPVNGTIDEVRLWNTALDSATIVANMMTDYATETPDMLVYYKLDQGEGEYIYDYSANDITAKVLFADDLSFGNNGFWQSPSNLLSSFKIHGEKYPPYIDATTGLYTVIVDSVDLTAIVADFQTQMYTEVWLDGVLQQSGVTANSYESGVNAFLLSGVGFNAGIEILYRVKVLIDSRVESELKVVSFEMADNPTLAARIELMKNGSNFDVKAPEGFTKAPLKALFDVSEGATVVLDNKDISLIPDSLIDYTTPQIVTVVSENGRFFTNYKIGIDTRTSTVELLDFNLQNEQVNNPIVNLLEPKLDFWVKNNTNISMLAPSFEVTPNASVYVKSIRQKEGISLNNFTNDVVYTIVSEDESAEFDWTISVKNDVEKPVITPIGDTVMTVVRGGLFSDPGVTAADNIDGDITAKVVVAGDVDVAIAGVYKLNYEVTDAAGNTAVAVRTVHVVFGESATEFNTCEANLYASDGILFVNVPVVTQLKQLLMFNSVGALVKTFEIVNSGLSSIVLHVQPGVYLVKMVLKDETIVAKIVVD